MPENSSKLSSTNPASPLPEIASDPICECDCVHCRAGNHRLCCKAAQCTPSPVPLGEPTEPFKSSDPAFESWYSSTNNDNWFSNKPITRRILKESSFFAWRASKAVPLGEPAADYGLIGCTPNATPEEIALRRKNRSAVPIEWLEKAEAALATKAVPIGEGELPPLPDETPEESAKIRKWIDDNPYFPSAYWSVVSINLRRERQLLQSQQREREWHSIKEQALTKMEEQRKRAELAEARLRSQERHIKDAVNAERQAFAEDIGKYHFHGKPLDSECSYGYHRKCPSCNCSCHDPSPYTPPK